MKRKLAQERSHPTFWQVLGGIGVVIAAGIGGFWIGVDYGRKGAQIDTTSGEIGRLHVLLDSCESGLSTLRVFRDSVTGPVILARRALGSFEGVLLDNGGLSVARVGRSGLLVASSPRWNTGPDTLNIATGSFMNYVAGKDVYRIGVLKSRDIGYDSIAISVIRVTADAQQ